MEAHVELSDFCGSPGFFDPEMVIKGCYFGTDADIWSAGCVLLEMVVGHDIFIESWMHAYSLESIKVKSLFAEGINRVVDNLPEILSVSEPFKDIILRMLKVDSRGRISIKDALSHSWLASEVVNSIA
jgi:serine/threonine protein kinase